MKISPTVVTFCDQTYKLETKVQLTVNGKDAFYLVTEETPFHPVSHIWPDHPADKGVIILADGTQIEVQDCVMGAIELSSTTLHIGEQIPVKRDTQGWVFVAVHCIAKDAENIKTLETISDVSMIVLQVDQNYQQALSRGHSAGHLASFALNKVLNDDYWRKDADRKDSHGYYDFNSYAQVSSFVTPDTCKDTYRLGKTLRKRGLNSAAMIENLATIERAVNDQLLSWLSLRSPVTMQCAGSALTDSRYWRCDLGESKIAEMPCGGTHVRSLTEFHQITVHINQLDEQHIEMHTLSQSSV